jgi:hypothetical protein
VKRFFAGILVSYMCVSCASWTAAEKAAPACYGLNAASLSTLVAEGKTIALDAAQCAAVATCPAGVEGALAAYLANAQLDEQAFDCVTEAIALEIKYPSGGETPYAPTDAGTPAPLPTTPDMALARAVAMTPVQTTALEGIASLQAHTHAARGGH